jgi:amino acid adenylation domain-containing protein
MQLETFLENSAHRHPDKVALICGGGSLTYADLETAANRLAHALRAAGIERGDRVAIHLENSAEAVIGVFAVLKAGGAFLMVNPTTKADKLSYILNNCRARALILPARKMAACADCWPNTPHLQTLILAGPPVAAPDGEAGDDPTDKRCLALEALLAETAYPVTPPPKTCIDIDLAALVYTSGSTGNPKGVMLTHLNMVSAATSITTYLENKPDDIILSVLPMSFDYGLYQVLMAVKFGGAVVLETAFAYPHAVLRQIVAERVTGFPIVPTMLAVLLQMDLRKYDLSRLRYITNTGAALPVEHIRRLRELLPEVTIYSMYGLTECKRVAYLPPEQIDIRPASVGKAMPNTEVYLVDEQGQRLPHGAVGELVVRGSNVMRGYWELPAETDHMLRPGPLPGERVLYSGDLFRTDAEGYLYFVGRRDDIIKSRGEKVSPKEVENVLCSHPAVAEAAVIGVPDGILGESIRAFVSLRSACEATEKEVLRHCAGRLEDFMVPGSVAILDTLPRNSNGKIDKRALKEGWGGNKA